VPLIEQTVGDIKRPLIILFAAVVCVLLVACANIANLASMRATARSREMAVRLALGAGRGRLLHQLLVESLVLAAIGGGLGFALAINGVQAIVSMFPATFPLPRAAEIAIDWRVLAFTTLASIGSAAAFGVAPAFQSQGRSLVEGLQRGSRSVTGAHSRMRMALVVGQVAVTVVLVVAAGLLMRSLVQLSRVDLGFLPERVLTMRMLVMPSPGDRDAPAPAARAIRIDEILDRVRTLPEVTAAGSIHFLPLSGSDSGTMYYRADKPPPPPGQAPATAVSVITPGYFRAMAVALRSGRELDARDRPGTPLIAIANQAFVKQTFPNEEPLGRHIRLAWSGGQPGDVPDFEIVGVVDDSRHGSMTTAPDPRVYLANAQVPNFRAALVVRTAGDPLRVASAVRRAVQEVNPIQGVSNVDTMETIVSESFASSRIQAVLMAIFGGVALLVACVGLYGVLAYSVEQRRREMGVRLALGAGSGSVLRLVLGEGLRLTALGTATGIVGAMAATRVLTSLLYEVRPTDPAVFTAVVILLLATATLACYLPARRATRVDPATVLRED
jgi:putative ABC transport system permease protein